MSFHMYQPPSSFFSCLKAIQGHFLQGHCRISQDLPFLMKFSWGKRKQEETWQRSELLKVQKMEPQILVNFLLWSLWIVYILFWMAASIMPSTITHPLFIQSNKILWSQFYIMKRTSVKKKSSPVLWLFPHPVFHSCFDDTPVCSFFAFLD